MADLTASKNERDAIRQDLMGDLEGQPHYERVCSIPDFDILETRVSQSS